MKNKYQGSPQLPFRQSGGVALLHDYPSKKR